MGIEDIAQQHKERSMSIQIILSLALPIFYSIPIKFSGTFKTRDVSGSMSYTVIRYLVFSCYTVTDLSEHINHSGTSMTIIMLAYFFLFL